jgi:DNA processing protein
MYINKLTVSSTDFPDPLRQIASVPKQLFHAGVPLQDLMKRPRIAIVGSRNVSQYGEQVTAQLACQLAEQGIVIISGLALGVDGIAHRAALEVNGLTIAVLPGPLEQLYPASHSQLARRIAEQGGALVSEYPSGTDTFPQNFIARNRLIAGLAQAVLITEAAAKSGSLHTANFARKQDKPVLAVPGNITSRTSAGANSLIREGAVAITSYKDVLKILGLTEHETAAREVRGSNASEQKILDLLLSGMGDGQVLLERSALPVSEFNQTLSILEIDGKIRSLGANQWGIR